MKSIARIATVPWLLLRYAYLTIHMIRLRRKLGRELARLGYVEPVCLGPQGWESEHLLDSWNVCLRCGNLAMPTVSNSASERRVPQK